MSTIRLTHFVRSILLPLIAVYACLHLLFFFHTILTVDGERVNFNNQREGPLVAKPGLVVRGGKVIQGIGSGKLRMDRKLTRNKFHPPTKEIQDKLPDIEQFHKNYLKDTAKRMYNESNGVDFVYFIFVNDAYEKLTMNWLCNTAAFEGVHERVILMSLEQKICDSVKEEWDDTIECLTIKVFNYKDGYEWGTQKYVNMLTMRAQMMRFIAEVEVPFVLVETDAVWFRDPVELFRNRTQAEDADIIVPIKSNAVKGDSLSFDPMVVLPTNGSRMLINELVARLEKDPRAYDQDVLNELCQSQFNGVVCRTFEYSEVSDGAWFKLSDNEKRNTRPIIVNNNMYVGVKNKESRQALNGLWFLSTGGGHCLIAKTKRILREYFDPPKDNT